MLPESGHRYYYDISLRLYRRIEIEFVALEETISLFPRLFPIIHAARN